MPAVSTPCIRLCTIDALNDLCAGCGRSLVEIGRWLQFSEAERREIMAALPARLAGLNGRASRAAET